MEKKMDRMFEYWRDWMLFVIRALPKAVRDCKLAVHVAYTLVVASVG
jgi:hypothetical protein